MSYTYTCHVGGEKNIFTDRQKCLDDCTGQCYDQEGIPLGDKYAWPCLTNQQIRNEVCCKVKGEGEECKEINIACVLERAAANITACSAEGARQRAAAIKQRDLRYQEQKNNQEREDALACQFSH